MAYVFDSSAIYALAKSGRTLLLVNSYTCGLAQYELGNTLLTERRLMKLISETEQRYLLTAISRALGFMLVRGTRGDEQEIIDISIKYGLSFYDASYVYMAKSLGMVLVTEDNKLAKKVKGYVETLAAEELG
jgi:predicted nucleic acid-binding protein